MPSSAARGGDPGAGAAARPQGVDELADALFNEEGAGGEGAGGEWGEDAAAAADALFRQQSLAIMGGGAVAAADALFGGGSDESEAESEVGFALHGAEAAADALFGAPSQGGSQGNPFDAAPPTAAPPAANPFGGGRPPGQAASTTNPFGEAPSNPF